MTAPVAARPVVIPRVDTATVATTTAAKPKSKTHKKSMLTPKTSKNKKKKSNAIAKKIQPKKTDKNLKKSYNHSAPTMVRAPKAPVAVLPQKTPPLQPEKIIYPAGLSPACVDLLRAEKNDVRQVAHSGSKPNKRGLRAAAVRPLSNQGKRVCPLSTDLVLWLRLFRGQTQGMVFQDAARLVQEHPRWPAQSLLIRHTEELITHATPDALLGPWFAKNPPRTGPGILRYLRLRATQGDAGTFASEVRHFWHNHAMGEADARTFYLRYRALLTHEDHWMRADHLLWEEKTKAVDWIMPLLDVAHRHLVKARLSLMTLAGDATTRVGLVPKALAHDEGLVFERTRWRRKRDVPAPDELILKHQVAFKHPKYWIRERLILARQAIQKKRYAEAYRLVAEHGLDRGGDFADAEWIAGWLSLRFLGQSEQALRHFQKLTEHVTTPLSLSRAYYWQGLALEKAGRQAEAVAAWTKASQHPSYFYGQLACLRLAGDAFPRTMTKPLFSPDEYKAFGHREEARIVEILAAAQLTKALDIFVEHFATILASHHERQLFVTYVAEHREASVVRAARKASAFEGMTLPQAYPVEREVITQAAQSGLDPALVLAVIRQESGFDHNAVSPAGARGLMQLMIATAKEWAQKLKMAFMPHKLSHKPFNITLGCAHLKDLMQTYDGNLVLVCAAYNGGAGNVAKWIAQYGDPRSSSVNTQDWIELIPFSETRTYVHRVIENIAWYRLRLALMAGEGGLALAHRESATQLAKTEIDWLQYAEASPLAGLAKLFQQ